MFIMYQAIFPTCLTNFMKEISVVGLKLSIPGGGTIGGMVNSTEASYIVDYKFYRLGYTSPSVL
jgi:hypothetical protein